MSYDPEREEKTEFISAWNSQAQVLPYNWSGPLTNYNLTFDLDLVGEGDSTLSSNVLNTPEEGLIAFFMGDVRSNSNEPGRTQPSGDLYEIHFDQSNGDFSSGGQIHRKNRQDDQCYSLYGSAELKLGWALRCGGDTLAPWVRVLGVLVGE